jgi:hypothetical protein
MPLRIIVNGVQGTLDETSEARLGESHTVGVAGLGSPGRSQMCERRPDEHMEGVHGGVLVGRDPFRLMGKDPMAIPSLANRPSRRYTVSRPPIAV